MQLVTMELTDRVGSELKVDKATLLDGSLAREIREVLERRGVVVARDIDVSDDELHQIAETLGEIRLDGKDGVKKESLIKVTLDKSQTHLAEYFLGTFFWHFDGYWEDLPPRASILTPRVLSPEGGQTEFINTYAAYEALPQEKKEKFDNLNVAHTLVAQYTCAHPNPTEEQLKDWRGYGVKIHPLIWHHQSGRKSIAAGVSAEYVCGMGRAESDELLEWLAGWCAQPQFVFRHQWQMGDLLIWDNTGTMHRVLPYDVDSGRRLHRVTLVGEEPLMAAA